MGEIPSFAKGETLSPVPEFWDTYSAEKYPWLHDELNRLHAHSPWTAEHSVRVGMLCHTGFNDTILTLAGLSHDIGKVIAPPEILDSQYLPPEWQIKLKHHPRASFQMLRHHNFPEAQRAAVIAVAHHEFQEHQRYPRTKLRHTNAELLAKQRSLALMDGVDSMLSDRPYRPGLTADQTILILSKNFPVNQIERAIRVYDELFK